MLERADSGRPATGILHVIHGHGGGTEHHVARADRRRRARAIATISRSPSATPGRSRSISPTARSARTRFDAGAPSPGPISSAASARRFAIDLVHLHNISGCRDGIVAALAAQDVPYGYTVHDLNFACPTILFLGVGRQLLPRGDRRGGVQCVPQGAAAVLRTSTSSSWRLLNIARCSSVRRF